MALLAVLVAAACGKDAEPREGRGGEARKPTAATKERGNFRPLEGLGGDLEVEVPSNAKPIGTVPGFENADKTFRFVVRSVGASSDYADSTALRDKTPSAKKWIKDEKLADGFYVTHTIDKVETFMEGDTLKSKVVGVEYSMMMRRQIGDTWYSCSCILPREELLDAVIKACTSIRKAE